MTVTTCPQAGCDGQVAPDGYCDDCGHAATPAAAPPTATGADQATPAGPDRCTRPDCDGLVAADGYCDDCGHAAGPAASGSTPTAGSGATRGTGSGVTRGSRASARTGSTGTGARRLGGGLVEVDPVPRIDPTAALLTDPQVPESKRFCSRCEHPVGRGRDGRPGRTEGFCPQDGAPFSFRPKLTPGMLVDDQYEVQGCLAHGGLGWIYLAFDRKIHDRPVVLKGLLDSGDADAAAAAKAELRSLAQVRHPNVVTIHNFATHPDDDGTPVGYIVMEYVGGKSLKQLLEQQRRPDGTIEPFGVAEAIAYALEILPALGHLHAQGLAYCDLKPENVIQYDQELKLIDLGAVLRMDDEDSAIYGTIGYQAPEIGETGPTLATEVFTVGRTLAVLALGIRPEGRDGPTPLPGPDREPLLAEHESFDRLLRRATDPDPDRRFASTWEMADQLEGVLREVLAVTDGTPRPRTSTIFSPLREAFAPDLLDGSSTDGSTDHGTGPGRPDPVQVAARLPDPLPDADGAGLLATASLLVRARLDAGEPAEAAGALDAVPPEEMEDWRRSWFTGVIALADRRPDDARAAFDEVRAALPGEAAAQLALAAAAECGGHDETAGPLYATLTRRDPDAVDAVFGLARVRLRAGDRAGARDALDGVAPTSSRHVTAQLSAVRTCLIGCGDPAAGPDELRAAAARLPVLSLDPAVEREERRGLLAAAVELAPADAAAASSGDAVTDADPLLARPWVEHDLRLAYERCLRESARYARDAPLRIALVDLANAVRPRTWV